MGGVGMGVGVSVLYLVWMSLCKMHECLFYTSRTTFLVYKKLHLDYLY